MLIPQNWPRSKCPHQVPLIASPYWQTRENSWTFNRKVPSSNKRHHRTKWSPIWNWVRWWWERISRQPRTATWSTKRRPIRFRKESAHIISIKSNNFRTKSEYRDEYKADQEARPRAPSSKQGTRRLLTRWPRFKWTLRIKGRNTCLAVMKYRIIWIPSKVRLATRTKAPCWDKRQRIRRTWAIISRRKVNSIVQARGTTPSSTRAWSRPTNSLSSSPILTWTYR